MMEADESCKPDIVEDNYAAQVMSASLELRDLARLKG